MISGSTPLRRRTPCKVGVSEEVWLQRAQVVTDPSNHTEMFGRVDVTHKTMKLAVAFGRPFGDESRQVTDGAQQVETAQPCSIKDLHKNLSCIRLKTTLIRCRRGRPPKILTILSRCSMISTVFSPIMLHPNKFGQVILFPVADLVGRVLTHIGHSFTLKVPTDVFRRFVDICRECVFTPWAFAEWTRLTWSTLR